MQEETQPQELPVIYHTPFLKWFASYFLAPFSWSRWADITTFSYGNEFYLLQGKVNSRNNSKKFKVIAIKNKIGVAKPDKISMEQLIATGLIDTTVKFN
jgi:hypothetical protein